MTATPSKYPQGKFNDKNCRWCDSLFSPLAPSHLYCTPECRSNSYADGYYQRQYGIGYRDVLSLLDKQNNLCAICKEVGFFMKEDVQSPLNVDHCHKTGVVRGLLCHNCNRALGLFKDDIGRLKTAIAYLEGATTISEESTYKCTEAHGPSSDGEDIV